MYISIQLRYFHNLCSDLSANDKKIRRPPNPLPHITLPWNSDNIPVSSRTRHQPWLLASPSVPCGCPLLQANLTLEQVLFQPFTIHNVFFETVSQCHLVTISLETFFFFPTAGVTSWLILLFNSRGSFLSWVCKVLSYSFIHPFPSPFFTSILLPSP